MKKNVLQIIYMHLLPHPLKHLLMHLLKHLHLLFLRPYCRILQPL